MHGVTPPPLVGGKTNANAIYTGLKSNHNKREGNEKQSTKKRPNCFGVLRASNPEHYTSTPVVNPDALHKTRQTDLARFHGVLLVPSWCVYGCNRPIG